MTTTTGGAAPAREGKTTMGTTLRNPTHTASKCRQIATRLRRKAREAARQGLGCSANSLHVAARRWEAHAAIAERERLAAHVTMLRRQVIGLDDLD